MRDNIPLLIGDKPKSCWETLFFCFGSKDESLGSEAEEAVKPKTYLDLFQSYCRYQQKAVQVKANHSGETFHFASNFMLHVPGGFSAFAGMFYPIVQYVSDLGWIDGEAFFSSAGKMSVSVATGLFVLSATAISFFWQHINHKKQKKINQFINFLMALNVKGDIGITHRLISIEARFTNPHNVKYIDYYLEAIKKRDDQLRLLFQEALPAKVNSEVIDKNKDELELILLDRFQSYLDGSVERLEAAILDAASHAVTNKIKLD